MKQHAADESPATPATLATTAAATAATTMRRRRMSGRDIHEAHRVSTPLELLFDLSFVVAIAAAASQLHHAVVEHHLAGGLLAYLFGFGAIWWAWLGFSWFSSAYDTDDASYRLWTMVQIVGVLILAAGIPKNAQGDYLTGTIGYVVMRIGLLAMWLRAAREHPERRQTAIRYALGIGLLQLLWVARLLAPASWQPLCYAVLMPMELAVPYWATRVGFIPWHAHHIAERYGLFTIIVLGECVLGASNAVASVIEAQGWSFNVALIGFGSASLVLALWWVYFLVPSAQALHQHRERAHSWGYGHFVVFGSLAALGAFLEVVADQLKAHAASATSASSHLVSPTLAIGLVALSVGVYLLTVWWLYCQVARGQARLGWAWLTAAVILALVVSAVAAGLPLAWAIPAVTLAPAVIIIVVEIGWRKWPERYRIR